MTEKESSGKNGQIACEVCLKEVPKSVAVSDEGAEYVRYFCGADCYQSWQDIPGIRQINLTAGEPGLDFDSAKATAEAAAVKVDEDAMLLAWFDRERGKESPEVPECMHKPGWLAYAESHGGNLKIDINEGAYIFIFSTARPD